MGCSGDLRGVQVQGLRGVATVAERVRAEPRCSGGVLSRGPQRVPRGVRLRSRAEPLFIRDDGEHVKYEQEVGFASDEENIKAFVDAHVSDLSERRKRGEL